VTRGRAADGPDATFQDLLLQYRGRTGLTQRELAARLGVHMRSIQAWEGGVSYPGASSLKALISGYPQAGGFEPGSERAQAEALWAAALLARARMLVAGPSATGAVEYWLALFGLEDRP
jgi:transcriptional regulator with XRE-family HTH domain